MSAQTEHHCTLNSHFFSTDEREAADEGREGAHDPLGLFLGFVDAVQWNRRGGTARLGDVLAQVVELQWDRYRGLKGYKFLLSVIFRLIITANGFKV